MEKLMYLSKTVLIAFSSLGIILAGFAASAGKYDVAIWWALFAIWCRLSHK